MRQRTQKQREDRCVKMKWLIALTLCALVSSIYGADSNIEWCYHEPICNDTTWPTIVGDFCNGTRQSPINIVSGSATANSSLTAFSFTDYGLTTGMTKMENTGKTVKVGLSDTLSVSGGGLDEPYESLQFHLHWGNGSSVPGSEHTVDGRRYPMELHIVNIKRSHNRNTTLALQDPSGFAALGFFVEEMSGNETGLPASWKSLTDLLPNISNGLTDVSLSGIGVSLDDLLVGVDRTSYYRYHGSLTTPDCFETVVWTVFKDSIKVSKDLIDLFSTQLYIGNNTTPLMVNVFRGIQPDLPVTTQASSSSNTCTVSYTLGLLLLSVSLWMN